MDIASLVGMIGCAVLVVVGIISGDAGVAALPDFYDFVSICITFGGSFCCVLMSNSMASFMSGIKSFGLIMKVPVNNTQEIINKIIDLSNMARKEGLLSLEEAAGELGDPFMQKGIMLIVDGTDPELVRAILETELISLEERHKTNIGFWEYMASMGPAWGMIGTLIGLVNMLKNLEDAATIGPNMAVALLTTLYGSMLANWIATPVATKLKANNASEMLIREIMIEGMLSIQAGENPRVIEEKLKSFLLPKDREEIGQQQQQPVGGEA